MDHNFAFFQKFAPFLQKPVILRGKLHGWRHGQTTLACLLLNLAQKLQFPDLCQLEGQNSKFCRFWWFPRSPRNSAEFRGIRVGKPPKMCLFLTIFRGKRPFFWDLRTCKTPLPRNSAEFARNSAEFGQRVARFSNIGHFFIILQQKSCFKFFFGHFGLSQPQISQIHLQTTKKRLKAPTGANQKNDTFWPVECQKTQTKMRTNTENHLVCVSASLTSHGTGRMALPSCHDTPESRTTDVGTFVDWLAKILKMRGKNT